MSRRAVCGTDSGYYRHLRSYPRTEPCTECRAAHAAAERARVRGEQRRPSTIQGLPRSVVGNNMNLDDLAFTREELERHRGGL